MCRRWKNSIRRAGSSDEVIEKGIRILGEACAELIAKKGN